MTAKTNSGFTIIETMLFLGVSGALAAGILVGVGGSINQQRYKDSVNSLRSFIQEQYSSVENTSNQRAGSEACLAGAVIKPSGGAVVGQPRGTSECVILGRHLDFSNDGLTVTASSVVGLYRGTGVNRNSDTLNLTGDYILQKSPFLSEPYSISWGARVTNKVGVPSAYSMMIVRSPHSGSILTYTAEGHITPQAIATADNNKAKLNLCVDNRSFSIGNTPLGVQVMPYSAGPGGVLIPNESERICG